MKWGSKMSEKTQLTTRDYLLSIQHLFAMFGATVLVPLLTGLNPSLALFSAGVGTLIFHCCTKFKVPVFLGSSFAFLAALSAIIRPEGAVVAKRGKAELLQRNWKSILYLLDEAQFVDEDTPPKLDERMKELAKKKPDHPAVKAYQRYRGGPDETIRSVIMTVNARMQPFDNEELLEIFSSNDIPLDEFGTGMDGDGKTKSNLFIIIPDDDDTFNFVPGMVYTLLFQELYRHARFFGGKLPMDVGFWLDEIANIKMPNNFDKILATCRSRGVYCVPILQSLAQLKTLFADGAWEGIVGNCDTFIYLGGNEASTYEYVSKLLGKWTIDKRTSGESKGTSGSYSENYDVLGRELMLEYELRLLPDDECIIFVRGENPIRDKKWFPWEHEVYLEARKCGAFVPAVHVAKGKNHRYGLCFTWDIANIDNNTDYVMLPALTGPEGARNITRQNNSETSGFDRGRCVLTSSCRNTALAAAWIDQMYAPLQSPQNNWGSYGEKDSFNIFELSTNKDGGEMLKHLDLGDQSPVEVREAQSVNGPLAVLNEYYDMYVTQPADAKWRLDNMHETYLKDMKSKYVYPNVFMSIDDTNKVSQYDTDIKKYAEQKKADWILNGGIDKEWDSYLKKMEKYGLSAYLAIKQKYFDQYQESLKEEK